MAEKCSFCGQPKDRFARENGKTVMCADCLKICVTILNQYDLTKLKPEKGKSVCSFCGSDVYVRCIEGPGVSICDACCIERAPILKIKP